MSSYPLTETQQAWVTLGPKAHASIDAQVEATREVVRLNKWSLTTEKCYCAWVRRFGVWIATHAEARSAADSTARVTGFLASLVSGPSPRSGTTLKQALNALVFYYKSVRREPLGRLGDLPQPKRAERLPHVLTREQVRQLIGAMVDTPDYPYALIVRLLYHTGMRIGDVLDLRIHDINWEQAELVLRDGKGGKDRVVPLPRVMLPELQRQTDRVRTLWQRDQRDTRDLDVPDSGLEKSQRTALGLELLAIHAKPGVTLTREDIAAWAGCTNEAIRRIEVRALRRLRKFGRAHRMLKNYFA